MPFNPFTALTSKIFGGVALALAVVCGILYWQMNRALDTRDKALLEAGALQTKLNASNASIDELQKRIEGQNEAIALIQREADERVASSRDALAKAREQGKGTVKVIERLRDAPATNADGMCRTSPTIIQNRDKL